MREQKSPASAPIAAVARARSALVAANTPVFSLKFFVSVVELRKIIPFLAFPPPIL